MSIQFHLHFLFLSYSKLTGACWSWWSCLVRIHYSLKDIWGWVLFSSSGWLPQEPWQAEQLWRGCRLVPWCMGGVRFGFPQTASSPHHHHFTPISVQGWPPAHASPSWGMEIWHQRHAITPHQCDGMSACVSPCRWSSVENNRPGNSNGNFLDCLADMELHLWDPLEEKHWKGGNL